MKLTVFVLALVAAAFAGGSALADAKDAKPDFSGAWKLNLAKSQLGGRDVSALVVTVEHKDPRFKYTAKGVADGNDFEETEEFTTDTLPSRDDRGNVTTAHWEGPVIVLETKSPEGDVLETGRLSLSPDGKTVMRDSVTKAADGENKVHEIFEKQ